MHKIVLVGDYKHYLRPIGVRDVSNRTIELKKGISQVNNYCNYLEKSSLQIEEKVFDLSEYTIYKFLVFQYPMPLPLDKVDIIMYDYGNFTEIIDRLNKPQLGDFIQLMFKNIRILDFDSNEYNMIPLETKVNDWTYIRHIYAK